MLVEKTFKLSKFIPEGIRSVDIHKIYEKFIDEVIGKDVDTIRQQIDLIRYLFDVDLIPPEYFRYLIRMFGIDVFNAPEDIQRMQLKATPYLLKNIGCAKGYSYLLYPIGVEYEVKELWEDSPGGNLSEVKNEIYWRKASAINIDLYLQISNRTDLEQVYAELNFRKILENITPAHIKINEIRKHLHFFDKLPDFTDDFDLEVEDLDILPFGCCIYGDYIRVLELQPRWGYNNYKWGNNLYWGIYNYSILENPFYYDGTYNYDCCGMGTDNFELEEVT